MFALSAAATNAQGVQTAAILDCGDWLDARKNAVSTTYEHYIIGLVDGLALGRAIDIWRPNNVRISRAQFYYWMDEYCKKNPLSNATTGSFRFADEVTSGEFTKKLKK